MNVEFGLRLVFVGIGGWRNLGYLLVELWLKVDVGFGLGLTFVGVGGWGSLECLLAEVSFAGVSSGLWLRVGIGLELGFRLGGSFGFGLEFGIADGLDWRWLDRCRNGWMEVIAETRVVGMGFAGVSSGLWLRVGVGLGLGFRLRNGFGFGLELGIVDGLDWQ